MNSKNLRERYFTGRAYIALSPAIFLTAIVWYTPDLVAIKLAHFFQVYLSLLLFFSCSYLLSQARITSSLFSKELALSLALMLFILAIGGGLLTYYLNPVYGLSFLLVCLLFLTLFKLSNYTKAQIPYWFKELIRKGNIMLCICLIVMLGYWLNPYSEPLTYFIK